MMERIKQRPFLAKLWPLLVVCLCFVAGGLLGCLFAARACEESTVQIGMYLEDYFRLTGGERAVGFVPAVLWNHGRWMLGCFALGLTVLGVAAIPVLFCMRGFLLAFGISCFFRLYGGVGLIPALLLFMIPALLWAPGLFAVGICALRGSVCLFQNRISGEFALPKNGGGGWARLLLGVLLLILCVLFERGILPVLLPSAARILR